MMMMNLRHTVLLFVIFHGLASFAQGWGLGGRVVHEKTGEALGQVLIHLNEEDRWTISNEQGEFRFENLGFSKVSLMASRLGLAHFSAHVSLSSSRDTFLIIKMISSSYDMEELTVLASELSGLGSSSIIQMEALEHIQANSIGDVLQLLPGNVIQSNPNMNEVQQLSIREIGMDGNSALGASIIVDGAPLSNNANLQTYSTNRASDMFSGTAGTGSDLRQLSADRIESVEVIKGIPSVMYGDMTSAVVLVNTKSGVDPLTWRYKTNALIKQFSLGKGMQLRNRNSDAINVHVDYLKSIKDLNESYNNYKRINLGFKYASQRMLLGKPLNFTLSADYFQSVDNEKFDRDAFLANESLRSADYGGRLSAKGRWSPESWWASNVNFRFAASYTHQLSTEKRYRSSEIKSISLSQTEGINEGIFLAAEELSRLKVDGKPTSLFAQISAHKTHLFGDRHIHNLLYGVEITREGNYGKGQQYDLYNPPYVSSYTSRPRSFNSIPWLSNFSYFVEDKLQLRLGETNLTLQGGVRANHFGTLGFFYSPRFNGKYEILTKKNNRIFEHLSVYLGGGRMYKAPILLYLYPDKAYFDLSALNYYTETAGNAISVFDTHIFSTENPDLNPMENRKYEFGLEFKWKGLKGNLTYFNELSPNGFSFSDNYVPIPYQRFDVSEQVVSERPNIQNLPSFMDTALMSFRRPSNNREARKEGLEYRLDFGKWKAVYTSLVVDGAWLRTTRVFSTQDVQYRPASASSEAYDFFGLYPPGERRIAERFNTNFRFVTHIPDLKLVLSTNAQVIWKDKYYYPFYDEVPFSLQYMDGTRTAFTSDMRSDIKYVRFVNDKEELYFQDEVLPTLFLLNLRLSKEIGKHVKFSIYVNNLTNYRPLFQLKRSGSTIRRNPPIYFGAELKLSI